MRIGSGFERRAFGIAHALALAEATCCRIPLVVDTPLGNADSKYRERTMDALTQADFLDQIIILTHDKEVDAKMHEKFKGKIRGTFLMEFDHEAKATQVYAGRYFEGDAQ